MNQPDISRFQGLQTANAARALQAKEMEAEGLRRLVVWMANAITSGGENISIGEDGSLAIPKADLDLIPRCFTLSTPVVPMKAEACCEACGAFTEGCAECADATEAAPSEPMVLVAVAKKEGDGNGVIQPRGPGLVLP